MVMNVYGALFYGMIATGIVAFFTGQLKFESTLMKLPSLPEGIIVWNPAVAFMDVFHYGMFGIVISFLTRYFI